MRDNNDGKNIGEEMQGEEPSPQKNMNENLSFEKIEEARKEFKKLRKIATIIKQKKKV